MSNKYILTNISHDDFPLETLPAQGTITFHYSDGSTKDLCGVGEKDYSNFYNLFGIKNKKILIKITNDGFPIETFPAQGIITFHYSDGSTQDLSGTPNVYNKYKSLF